MNGEIEGPDVGSYGLKAEGGDDLPGFFVIGGSADGLLHVFEGVAPGRPQNPPVFSHPPAWIKHHDEGFSISFFGGGDDIVGGGSENLAHKVGIGLIGVDDEGIEGALADVPLQRPDRQYLAVEISRDTAPIAALKGFGYREGDLLDVWFNDSHRVSGKRDRGIEAVCFELVIYVGDGAGDEGDPAACSN